MTCAFREVFGTVIPSNDYGKHELVSVLYFPVTVPIKHLPVQSQMCCSKLCNSVP